ncbi:MAG: hypothetical protein WBF13_07160 [Candidatus Zixiibacteriota bacterium]
MAEAVRKIEYFYATVENKPGEGSRLLQHFSEKGVNLLAFTAFPLGQGRSQLDFLPESTEKLQEAATDAGVYLVGPKKAFLIQGDDRVGALVEHHLRLSSAGINVYAANGVSGGSGKFGYVLWVKPEDFEKAARALGV